MAAVLKPELEKHNLLHKATACVKDGGGNLRTCTQIIHGITDCKAIGLDMCFDGVCFAHILSSACNYALRDAVDAEFEHRPLLENRTLVNFGPNQNIRSLAYSCLGPL